MINAILKYKVKHTHYSPPDSQEIMDAERILFALFTRYGDTVIDLAVIREFIQRHPQKYYAVMCTRQMVPYVQKFLPAYVDIVAINKRNPFDMLKAHYFLKQKQFDVGFNPWSYGDESALFLGYCKYALCYQDFHREDPVNHYDIVRSYLGLKREAWHIESFVLRADYRHILLCPESTDPQRSLDPEKVGDMVEQIKMRYPDAEIIIAAMHRRYADRSSMFFAFQKKQCASVAFLALVDRSDLMICVDSGPLHIALLSQKDTVALFSITSPEIVINRGSRVLVRNIESLYEEKGFLWH